MSAPLFDTELCPDTRPAAVCGEAAWTYAELRSRVLACMAWLRRQGVREDTLVAVTAPSSLEFLVLVHALWELRATLVPLNLRLTAAERAAQIARLGRCVSLTRAGDEWHAEWPRNPPLVHAPRGMQLLLFTSGTTGTPKGALISFDAIAASARAARQRLGYLGDERWLCCLPLYHVAGLSILYRCAFYGASVLLQPDFGAAKLEELVEGQGITALSLVPTQLSAWLDARGERPAPRALRSILLGGAKASPALLARAQRAGIPIAPTFGMTETASQVCTLTPQEFAATDLGGDLYLPPLPGVETYVKDAGGGEGEVWLRGPSLFSGYLNDPVASRAARDELGWFRTGDWGRRRADGALCIVERRSDLIVTGGENVYPAEIEAVLESHPAVKEAGVFALSDERWGQRVAAAVVLKSPAEPSTLESHCRERVAGYKVPRSFFICGGLPRTATGKLQRAALREEFDSGPVSDEQNLTG